MLRTESSNKEPQRQPTKGYLRIPYTLKPAQRVWCSGTLKIRLRLIGIPMIYPLIFLPVPREKNYFPVRGQELDTLGCFNFR